MPATTKVPLDGVIQSQAVLIAIGINGEGRRQILGMEMRDIQRIVIGLLVGVGLGCGVAGGFGTTVSTASDAIELSQDDRQEILDLISRYSYTFDGRDAEGWVALFADDGIMVFPSEELTPQELLVWARNGIASARESGRQGRHYQTNTVLEPLSDGSVSGETMMQVTVRRRDEPAPTIAHTGIYRDRFVKTDSGWKFGRREILPDLP